jgi:hypothetical protein
MYASLLLIMASLSAWATPPAAPLLRTFEHGFHSPQVYSPLACHQNVRHLLQRMRRTGVDLRRWRVVFLAPVRALDESGALEISGDMLTPLQPRGGEVSWLYHVVATDGVQVLDLDLGEIPRIVGALEYLDTQFGRTGRIGARSYRADLYVRQYSDDLPPGGGPLRNWAYYLYGIDGTPMAPACQAFGSC